MLLFSNSIYSTANVGGQELGSEPFFGVEWKTMCGKGVCHTTGSIESDKDTVTTKSATEESWGVLMELR